MNNGEPLIPEDEGKVRGDVEDENEDESESESDDDSDDDLIWRYEQFYV